MQASPVISLSPSFNSYSNTRLADIAARVVEEFGSDEFYFEREGNSGFLERESGNGVNNPDEDDGEFEFATVERDSELASPVSADDIFCNGQIRPVYPVFDRSLFSERNGDEKENDVAPTVRLPLRKLFIEERETTMTTMSSSSSEADELEGVPAETYCVWRPKAAAEAEAEAEEGRCKKSSSTGSISKRWKFRDLLHRSHSDGGKDRFVFLSPSSSGRRKENEGGAGKVKPTAANDGGEKRRSYLPYKHDLVGLFSTVNGLSKNLQPI